MKIGFDIDDTTTDSYDVVKEYLEKYDKDYSNDNHLINNFEDIIRGFMKDEIVSKFFQDHSKEIGNAIKIKPKAKEIIDKLHNEGFKIYFITARSDRFYNNAQDFCENYLKRNNIYYDKLITGQAYKVDTCKKEKIDLMIDDAIDTCESINKENIKAVLFTSKTNIDKETICDRVSNWDEVYNYIHNYVKKIQR